MSAVHWIRLGCILALSLVLGCGGGGGDGPDDGITRGTWYTNIDILTEGCGPDVREVTGSDFTDMGGGRVRLSVYLDETDLCLPRTWELFGTETAPGVYAMDDVTNDFVCALEEAYGYGFFDLTNATFTKDTSYDRFEGDFSAEYGATTCSGSIFITLTPR